MNQLWLGTTWADIVAWLPELAHAFTINLQVTVLTLLFGLPGGFFLALAVQAKRAQIRWPALAFVEIGRGAPALVLVQFVYFGLPQAGMTATSFWSAVLALAVSTACYTSEIIRSGLDAVPRGQKEAVAAMNISGFDGMRYVVLPQALKISTPALMGFGILVLQSTTLCFTIALPEVVAKAYEIGSISFVYFPILVLTAVFFVAVCIPASVFVGWLERDKSK